MMKILKKNKNNKIKKILINLQFKKSQNNN